MSSIQVDPFLATNTTPDIDVSELMAEKINAASSLPLRYRDPYGQSDAKAGEMVKLTQGKSGFILYVESDAPMTTEEFMAMTEALKQHNPKVTRIATVTEQQNPIIGERHELYMDGVIRTVAIKKTKRW